MSLIQVVSVAMGGAVGAVARFSVAVMIEQKSTTLFPWGTFTVNAVGCLVLGALFEMGTWITIGPELRLALTVGVLGAFTTFSTFALETLNLFRDREWLWATANLTGNLLVGLLACLIGVWLARVGGKLFAG